MLKISEKQAREIYSILMQECGASPRGLDDFVVSAVKGCPEYRFQGSLGFGGKFRNVRESVYVDCYPEDLTSKRKSAIAKANAKLRDLRQSEILAGNAFDDSVALGEKLCDLVRQTMVKHSVGTPRCVWAFTSIAEKQAWQELAEHLGGCAQ